MNKLFESLNKIIKNDKPIENRRLRHPKETEIITQAMNTLSQSDMGTELIEFVQDNNISIHVLRGRDSRDHSNSDKDVYISVAEGAEIKSPEIVILLVGAIRETAHEYNTHLRRLGVEHGESIYVHREGQKFEDKLYWQTGIVYELGVVAGKTDYIDMFTLMGYSSLIDAYEQDLKGENHE